ncbi:MAG: glutamine--fructose-6-phosphate transaminase (isomerizing) [Euryarchaeota archaeon]|nr:glutamine--fructose-6-phosphate transaminase (isomerizing) [Euryarchaeota archaeon]|tara:strand:- start:7486 stop:9312 length:1827 start_codon:yes stop_codon:yes gene_type:complete
MCGIYGCIGHEASGQVLEGLRKLEYRGYDSAGLAAIFPQHKGPIETERTVGYVSDLVSKANGRFNGSHISIGHTRWATHGGVTDYNAHPHSSNDGNITVVHNGIIENSLQLSEKVSDLGYQISSETDTEVIVHLLDHELKIQQGSRNHLLAFCNVISQLEGSWAIAAIMSDLEGILISRNGAPMVIGRGVNNISVSSDVQPFYGACSEVAYMNDGDNFLLTKKGIESLDGLNKPEFNVLDGVYDEQDPGIFPHMMLKEIHDQPTSLSNVLSGRISADGSKAKLSGFTLSPEEMKNLDKINFVSCGTAYYASLIITEYIRKFSNVPVEAFRASEFPALESCSKNTLTIGITQSGETKDTLDALLQAKQYGSHVSSMCNVIGSTISRFTGNGAYLYAGPEYAVASTKVFTNMLANGLLLALTISDMSHYKRRQIVQSLRMLPNLLASQLMTCRDSVEAASKMIQHSNNVIFIGRGHLTSKLVEEGALKMMEVSYIPCLAYPGGELKHGPIALIEEGTPVIAIAPSDSKLNLMESSIRECKARGAKIILITDHDGPITQFADVVIETMKTHSELSPFVNIIPLQLLAYNAGINREINVDRPRNLAKSVTVV